MSVFLLTQYQHPETDSKQNSAIVHFLHFYLNFSDSGIYSYSPCIKKAEYDECCSYSRHLIWEVNVTRHYIKIPGLREEACALFLSLISQSENYFLK